MLDKVFIDTNVLIYLINKDSPFHKKSLTIFTELLNSSELWISRQILREYAVIASRPDLVEKPVQGNKLIADIEKFKEIFYITDETNELTDNLFRLVEKYNIIGKKIHDVNIVASMITYSIPHLFTYNQDDFKYFDEIEMIEI